MSGNTDKTNIVADSDTEFNFDNPRKVLRVLLSELISYDEILDFAKNLLEQIDQKHTTLENRRFATVSQCILECYKRILGFQSTRWASYDKLKYQIRENETPIVFERQVASGEYLTYKIFNEDQLIIDDKNVQTRPLKGKEEVKEDDIPLKNIIRLVEAGENVFITGHAGTGKSYILERLKERFKKLVLTSTTGIAAVNIKGQTIHSWAGVGICKYPVETVVKNIQTKKPTIKKQIEKCKILAVDEISMLNIKTLEYVDKVLRLVREDNRPFGGIQVIFLGDFFQLPPVEKNEDVELSYCFESPVWSEFCFKNVVLSDNHRQNEENFIKALSNIRTNSPDEDDINLLKTRVLPCHDKNILHIFPTNKEADSFNDEMFREIQAEVCEFRAKNGVLRGKDYVYEGINELDEKEKTVLEIFNKSCKAENLLCLKTGARVMLLINLDFKAGLVNGSSGTVLELNDSSVTIKFDNDEIREIRPEIFEYYFNEKPIAIRVQLPLKLAYAITIHKSQGMTLDRLYVDCKRIFERGQVYVAMSRVKTLSGLFLDNFSEDRILVDNKVVEFYKNLRPEPFVLGLPPLKKMKNPPNEGANDEKAELLKAAERISEIILKENRWIKISEIADIMGVKKYDRLVNGKTSSTIAHIINRFLKKKGFKTATVKYYMSSIIWAAPPNLGEDDMPDELSEKLKAQSA